MAKKRLNKKVAIIGSAVLAFFVLATIVVVLHFSKDPMKFLEDARAALKLKDYKAAETNYRRAYGASKDDKLKTEILFELSDFHLIENTDVPQDDPSHHEPNWNKAISCWKTVLNIDPKNIPANNNILEFYYEAADSGNINLWEEVKSRASELIEITEENGLEVNPFFVRAKARAMLSMAALGQTTDREGTLSDAVVELNRLKDLVPDDASTYNYLAQAAMVEGEINSSKGVIDATQSAKENTEQLLREAVEIMPDDPVAYINLLEFKKDNIDISDADAYKSLESELKAMISKFDSNAGVYATLSKFYMLKTETIEDALNAIAEALRRDAQNIDYVIYAANLNYRKASVNDEIRFLEKAIQLASKALDYPDAKDTPGPSQFARKRTRLTLLSFLSSWNIEMAINAEKQDDPTQQKEQYIEKAEQTVYDIEQLLGTSDNINMVKWNGMLDYAKGNKDQAIRQLYKAYEGFKAAGQPDSLVSYTLSEIFKNRMEIGLKKEFLEYSISPRNNMVLYKPQILLDYATVLFNLESWINGIKVIEFYENISSASHQSSLLKARGYIGAGITEEAEHILNEMDSEDIDVLKTRYLLYRKHIAQQNASKQSQQKPQILKDETDQTPRVSYNESDMQNYISKAKDTLEKLNRLDPGNPERAIRICRNYIEEGRFEEAKKIIGKLIEIEPKNLNAQIAKLTLNEPDPANISGERLEELSLDVIRNITDDKDRTVALAIHYNKLEKTEDAMNEFAKACALSPEDNFIFNMYFNVALSNNKLSIAEELVGKAKESNLDFCDGNYLSAKLLQTKELYQDALKDLDYCIEMQPTLENPYFLRSQINNSLGNVEEAISDINAARRINPLSGKSARLLASLLYKRSIELGANITAQQVAETEQAIVRAIILNPKEYNIRSLYADYISDRDPQRALSILGSLQNINPTTINILRYAAMAQKIAYANSNLKYKDALMEIARSAYEKAYEMDAKNSSVLSAYSEFLRITGKQAQATELLSKNSSVRWKYYARDGQYEKAGQILEELYKENHEQEEVIRGLMFIALRTNNTDDTKKYSQKLLEINNTPENELYVMQYYLEIGLTEEAETKLDSFTERNPDNSQAALLKAWVSLSKGQLENALKQVNYSLELEPKNASAWRLRGRTYRLLGNYDKAIEDFQKSKNIQIDPTIRVELAKAYNGTGRTAAAIGELVEALKEGQAPTEVRTMLEALYLKANRKSELEKFYAELLEQFPDKSLWFFRAGSFYLRERNFEKAQKLLSKSLELAKDDTEIVNSLDIYLESLFQDKRYDEVLKIASEYIDKPQAPIAYAQMAQTKFLMGNRATAIAYYRKAIEKSEINEAYIAGILENMLKIAGKDEVEKWCNEKLQEDKDSLVANLTMYKLSLVTGDFNKSLVHIDNLLRVLGPEHPAWIDNMIEKANTLIMAYLKTSDKKYLLSGIEQFEQILEVTPKNSSVLNNLAYLLADNNEQLEKAEEYAKRAHEASPNDGNNLDTYAYTLCKNGKYEKAEELLQMAIQIFERNSQRIPWDLYNHLGMAQEGLGNNGAAAAAYRQALDVAGQNISEKDSNKLKNAVERLLK
jgi:tetratricopeptide (TPR) repeat protein